MLNYLQAGAIEEPGKCPNAMCGKTMTMQLMHNLSEYNNKQLIKMQVCLDATPSLHPSRYMLVTSTMPAQHLQLRDVFSGRLYISHQSAASGIANLELHLDACHELQ